MCLTKYICGMEKKPLKTDFLTTAEAAAELGIGLTRTLVLLRAGKFVGAQKIGRDWIIPRASLAHVTVYGKPGRPWPKKKTKGNPNDRK
jgi:hypothetical protein